MGFFDIFRKSVKKTKQNLSLELDNFSGKITADTLEELEEILILADVGVRPKPLIATFTAIVSPFVRPPQATAPAVEAHKLTTRLIYLFFDLNFTRMLEIENQICVKTL